MSRLFAAILLLVCALTSACSSVDAGEGIQKSIQSRAKETALQLISNFDAAVRDIIAGKYPYVSRDNPNAFVYLYDLELTVVAHPDPKQLGTSHANRVDDHRKAYPQQILTRVLARKKGDSGWIEYTVNGFYRIAFYELAQARDGNYYIVVSTQPVGQVQ